MLGILGIIGDNGGTSDHDFPCIVW